MTLWIGSLSKWRTFLSITFRNSRTLSKWRTLKTEVRHFDKLDENQPFIKMTNFGRRPWLVQVRAVRILAYQVKWSSGVWWFGGTITTAKWSTGRQSWSTFFDHRCCIPGNPIWIESLYRWRYHTSIWAWLRWSQNYVTYLNYVRVLYRAFHYVPISDFVCTWVTITLSFRIKKKLYKTVDNMSDNDKMTSERLSDFLILP